MPNVDDQNHLMSALGNLFGSSRYSDLTVVCGADKWEVHRAVLCLRCEFFAAACDRDFKEANEALNTLDDDDPATVGRMMKYLYTLDYCEGEPVLLESQDSTSMMEDISDSTTAVSALHPPVVPGPQSDGESPQDKAVDLTATIHSKLMNNARVYALAEKYNIPPLMTKAEGRFLQLSYIELKGIHQANVINFVYDSTPDSVTALRRIVAYVCARNIKSVLLDSAVCDVIKDHSDLALYLLRKVTARHDYLLGEEVSRGDSFRDLVTLWNSYLGEMYDNVTSLEILQKDSDQITFDAFHQAFEAFQRKCQFFMVWSTSATVEDESV